MSDNAASPSTSSAGGTCSSTKPIDYKLDWYQTETHVVLSVLAKNVDPDKFQVEFTDSDLTMNVVFKDGTEHERYLYLFDEIIAEKCVYKVLSTKVELKLFKKVGSLWASLEKHVKEIPKRTPRNWDKYVAELDEEKLEGEAVLNALFHKIYSEGSDEVKKAMNKSFMESGGTELNTNWDAVSKGKVSIKPPEGMEWRNWDN